MTDQIERRCPRCDREDRIDIAANVWVRVTDDGTDHNESADGSHYYQDDSPAICRACGHAATVAEFTPEVVPELLAALRQAVAALNTAPRFRVPSLGEKMDSYKIAALCERAILKVESFRPAT